MKNLVVFLPGAPHATPPLQKFLPKPALVAPLRPIQSLHYECGIDPIQTPKA